MIPAARAEPVAARWRHLYDEVPASLAGLGLHLDTAALDVAGCVAAVTGDWSASRLPAVLDT